jgi:hypothetical protein
MKLSQYKAIAKIHFFFKICKKLTARGSPELRGGAFPLFRVLFNDY